MKKAYIVIRDRHFDGSEDEPGDYGELKTNCLIGREGSSVVIRYKEITDGEGDCVCMLSISGKKVTLVRNGIYCITVIFEAGQRNTCVYHTPYGEIYIGVYTNAMFIDMTEDGGCINIAYTLDNSGDFVSENELKISVEVRESDNVSIS